METMEPQQQIAQTNLESMNYIGPSMNPIFKAGDRLRIISYDLGKIRAGDVVVFVSPEDGSKVVHRVISVNSDGIRTRGDNSYHEDAWVLSREHIIGRVVAAQRGNRRRRVFGGPLGRLFAASVRVIRAIDSRVCSLLRPAYEELAKGGIVIGRWLPGMSRWHIRRPFRLFVDEASLPENPARGSVVRSPLSVVDEDI
jgi:signal peptidase